MDIKDRYIVYIFDGNKYLVYNVIMDKNGNLEYSTIYQNDMRRMKEIK